MRARQLFAMAWIALIPGWVLAGEPTCDSDSTVCPSLRVPEPETLALLGVGAVAFLVARRRKKK